METETVPAEDLNAAEVAEPTPADTSAGEPVAEPEVPEESIDDVKARLAKAEELSKNYKIRAEKAEKASKQKVDSTSAPTAQVSTISTKDLYALMEAKVPQDDVAEVEEYAKFKGISITDALKSSTVKTLLAEKAEQRTTADATNVGTSRRGAVKLSDDALITKARKGEFPDSDEDIARLEKARLMQRRKK